MELFSENLNNDNEVRSGDFLLAEPMLLDPNFQRTVVIVCEHKDDEGSFGLIVNRQADVNIEQLEDFLYLQGNLYVGGPVQQNTLHFLHQIPELEGSILLRDGVYWGGDYEQLKELHIQGKVNAHNCRFFIGYSGWGKLQLKGELLQNSWVISRVDLSLLFKVEPDELWQRVLEQMGGKYKMFTNYPVDPSLN
ncbi:MAG: YqgE/AlgH family protein [Flammeovirgaceae bacterium]